MRYSCYTCHTYFELEEKEKEVCPNCGETVIEKRCINDHPCVCPGDVHAEIVYCTVCGRPTCPCGCEDVVQISRVTGFEV